MRLFIKSPSVRHLLCKLEDPSSFLRIKSKRGRGGTCLQSQHWEGGDRKRQVDLWDLLVYRLCNWRASGHGETPSQKLREAGALWGKPPKVVLRVSHACMYSCAQALFHVRGEGEKWEREGGRIRADRFVAFLPDLGWAPTDLWPLFCCLYFLFSFWFSPFNSQSSWLALELLGLQAWPTCSTVLFNKKFELHLLWVCMCDHIGHGECVWEGRGQPMGVRSLAVWIPGTELESSGLLASAFIRSTISLAPSHFAVFLKPVKSQVWKLRFQVFLRSKILCV